MKRLRNALLASCLCLSTSIWAAAPIVKASPGYYRMMLGAFEVTALSDGTVALPVDKILTNTTPESVNKILAENHLHSPLETSVNAYLINTGEKLVLIDTGAAHLFGPTLGKMLNHLKAAGYQPEQVDEIYITHLHPDHMGGLMTGDKTAFPNAIVRVDKHDVDYWLNNKNLEQAPAEAKSRFQAAHASLDAYVKANKLKTFDGNTDLIKGIKAMANYGHTPGHTVYMVESNQQKLLLWGDLMHVAAVQFPNPAVTIQFDSDSKAAAEQRQRIFSEAAKQGYMIGGAHISFPGLGRLRSEGNGYTWLPVNYSQVQ